MEESVHRARLSPALREGERVRPLELFFDLVFVLAITQCTALILENPSWGRLAEAVLVLVALCVPHAFDDRALEFAAA